MLERTSACLDNGVRLSLRATRQFHKSRRLLHSHFWTPQAPDLDAALAHPQPPSAAASHSSHDPQDAPFLDFLYPASTQAFMTRLFQWERWSRRNTRLPVLRGYSSLTASQDSSSRPRQDLRTLLDSNPSSSPSDLDIERVWRLCSQIDHSVPDLIQRSIIWFSHTENRSAAMHATALFADLPDHHRSAAVYRAAIIANLLLDRVHDSTTLHEQASNLPFDGSIGSEHLIAAAVDKEDWAMALAVLKLFETYTTSSKVPLHDAHLLSEPSDLPRLWSKVRELADFDQRLESLRCHCQQNPNQTSNAELNRLFEIMLNEFILYHSRRPIFGKPGNRAVSLRARIRRFIASTQRENVVSTKGFEALLQTLLRAPTSAANRECSALLSFAWSSYRQSDCYNPSKSLFLELLRFWRDHTLAFAKSESSSSFVGMEEIVQEWKRHHENLDNDALVIIMDAFAKLGNVDAVKEYAAVYKSLHPEGLLDASHLWPLIYVHAILARPDRALGQLDRLKKEYGVRPNTRCWNIVLHAYEEANDLTGAAEAFLKMSGAGFEPDVYTYGPLLNLYAKRGDVDGVIDLLDHAKSNGLTRPTVHMLNSVLVALVNNNDLQGALKALERTIEAVKANEAEGSLTLCFNTILVAYALRRDLQSTMDVYQRMQRENVRLDGQSYGAMIQVLCSFRQSPSAHRILKTVMPNSNIRPMAFHYAILMAGYINQGMFSEALKLGQEMSEANVRPTASSRAIWLKAKASQERADKYMENDESGNLVPLDESIEAFKQLLEDSQVLPRGNQPAPGFRHESSGSLSLDVGHLLFIHGQRKSFEAVQTIWQLYQDKLSQSDGAEAPMLRLLSTLMSVHCQAGEYALVDQYWELIRSRVEQLRLAHVPATDLKQRAAGRNVASRRNKAVAQIPPAYRFMLSTPFRYYIISQFSQSSSNKVISMASELLSEGYSFDNKTWNEYIMQLCRTSPPRALLAFRLVERFMMRNWPGWITTRRGVITNRDIFPKKAARAQGLEYIRARYLSYGQLIPQYKTMVHLASALLEVRGLETSGIAGEEQDKDYRELKKQVGSIREIRDKAPRTLHAVQSMPRVVDQLQARLLGGVR